MGTKKYKLYEGSYFAEFHDSGERFDFSTEIRWNLDNTQFIAEYKYVSANSPDPDGLTIFEVQELMKDPSWKKKVNVDEIIE